MIFNNAIIKKSGYFSFLICKKDLISFYKKHEWVKLKNKNILVIDYLFSTNGMIFNKKKLSKNEYQFFINK